MIEVDGPIHDYTPTEDAIRQEFLESQGYRVLRFTNGQVLQETEKVLQEISSALQNDLGTGDSTSPPALLSEFGEGDRG